jgi:hypothetical protein
MAKQKSQGRPVNTYDPLPDSESIMPCSVVRVAENPADVVHLANTTVVSEEFAASDGIVKPATLPRTLRGKFYKALEAAVLEAYTPRWNPALAQAIEVLSKAAEAASKAGLFQHEAKADAEDVG